MLVIHPTDKTTEMLSILYEGLGARLIETDCSSKKMGYLLRHTSPSERILLLGHGSDKGLYYRKNDKEEDFDGIIVGHPQAYYLRKHCGGIIGIWCHAMKFAKKEGLHGLFSGMIISEEQEAVEYGITATKQEVLKSNTIMFEHLRWLLDEEIPLCEIPQRIKNMDAERTSLSVFNYNNFHYMRISLRWYRCSGQMVPRGADAWYRL